MLDTRPKSSKKSTRRQFDSCLLFAKEQPVIMDGYQKLRNAIIEQAVKDYREISKKKYLPKHIKEDKLKEIENFFLSQWFEALTDIEGSYILERLKEEQKNGHIKKNKDRRPTGSCKSKKPIHTEAETGSAAATENTQAKKGSRQDKRGI